MNNFYSILSTKLNWTKKWIISPNDKIYSSKRNNKFIFSNVENSILDFDFVGNGFSIYGGMFKNGGSFDIYIDGKLISSNVSVDFEFTKMLTALYSWKGKYGKHSVKVVLNNNGYLIVDGIGLYGQNSKLL